MRDDLDVLRSAPFKEEAFVKSAVDAAIQELRAQGSKVDESVARREVDQAARSMYRNSMQKMGRGPTCEEAIVGAVELARMCKDHVVVEQQAARPPVLDVGKTLEAVNSFLDHKPPGYDESRTEKTAIDMVVVHRMFKRLLSGDVNDEKEFTPQFFAQIAAAEEGMKSGGFGDGIVAAWKLIDEAYPRSSYDGGRKGLIDWHRDRWLKIQSVLVASRAGDGGSDAEGVTNRLVDQMKSDLKPVMNAVNRNTKRAAAQLTKKVISSLTPVTEHRKPNGELWPDWMTYASKDEQGLVGNNDALLFDLVLKKMPKDHPSRPGIVENLVKFRKKTYSATKSVDPAWIGVSGMTPDSKDGVVCGMIMDNEENILVCLPKDRHQGYLDIKPNEGFPTWDAAYKAGVLKDGDEICSCGRKTALLAGGVPTIAKPMRKATPEDIEHTPSDQPVKMPDGSQISENEYHTRFPGCAVPRTSEPSPPSQKRKKGQALPPPVIAPVPSSITIAALDESKPKLPYHEHMVETRETILDTNFTYTSLNGAKRGTANTHEFRLHGKNASTNEHIFQHVVVPYDIVDRSVMEATTETDQASSALRKIAAVSKFLERFPEKRAEFIAKLDALSKGSDDSSVSLNSAIVAALDGVPADEARRVLEKCGAILTEQGSKAAENAASTGLQTRSIMLGPSSPSKQLEKVNETVEEIMGTRYFLKKHPYRRPLARMLLAEASEEAGGHACLLREKVRDVGKHLMSLSDEQARVEERRIVSLHFGYLSFEDAVAGEDGAVPVDYTDPSGQKADLWVPAERIEWFNTLHSKVDSNGDGNLAHQIVICKVGGTRGDTLPMADLDHCWQSEVSPSSPLPPSSCSPPSECDASSEESDEQEESDTDSDTQNLSNDAVALINLKVTDILSKLLEEDDPMAIRRYLKHFKSQCVVQSMAETWQGLIFERPVATPEDDKRHILSKLAPYKNKNYFAIGELAIAYEAKAVLSTYMKIMIETHVNLNAPNDLFDQMVDMCLDPEALNLSLLPILAEAEWVPRDWLNVEAGHQLDFKEYKHTKRLWLRAMQHVENHPNVIQEWDFDAFFVQLIDKMFFDNASHVERRPSLAAGSFLMELVEDILVKHNLCAPLKALLSSTLTFHGNTAKSMLDQACRHFGMSDCAFYEDCLIVAIRAGAYECFDWMLVGRFRDTDHLVEAIEPWMKNILQPSCSLRIKNESPPEEFKELFLEALTTFTLSMTELITKREKAATMKSALLVAEEEEKKSAEAFRQSAEYKEVVQMQKQAAKEREKLRKEDKHERQKKERDAAAEKKAVQARADWFEAWKARLSDGAKYADKNFDDYRAMPAGKKRDSARENFWKRRDMFHQLAEGDRTEIETSYPEEVKAFLDKYEEKRAVEKSKAPKDPKAPKAPKPPPIEVPSASASSAPSVPSSSSSPSPPPSVNWDDPRVAMLSRKQKKRLASGELSLNDLPPLETDAEREQRELNEALLRSRMEEAEREHARVVAEREAREAEREAEREHARAVAEHEARTAAVAREEIQREQQELAALCAGANGKGRGKSRGGKGGRGGRGGRGVNTGRLITVPDEVPAPAPAPALATLSTPTVVPLANASAFEARAPESSIGGETTCGICMVHEKNHAAVPCGHMCVCAACSKKLKKCPICRVDVRMWIKVHAA